MSKNVFFISTNLEINYFSKKKILAGNWCFENFNKLANDDIELIGDLWEDQNIRSSDYEYLDKLINLYSEKLFFYMNSFSNENFSPRFWNILLMPWLTIYLPSQYYRWKVIKEVIRKEKYFNFYSLINLDEAMDTIDTLDYYDSISKSQEFNYKHFRRMLEYHNEKDIKINFIKKELIPKLYNKKKEKNKNFLGLNLDEIFNYLGSVLLWKNNIFLEKGAFRAFDNIKMSFFLKQFPSFLSDGFGDKIKARNLYNSCLKNTKKRKIHDLNNGKQNRPEDEFINYIDKFIIDDIPICFLEGLKNLEKKNKKIYLKPKIILSSYRHYFDELFKIWTAFSTENGISKLFIVSHGSGNQLKFRTCLGFEKKICDKKINWILSEDKNEIQLPATKFLNSRKKRKTSEYLCLVDYGASLFPHRIGTGKSTFTFSNSKNSFIKLFENFNNEIKQDVIYIPYAEKKESYKGVPSYLKSYLSKSQVAKKGNFEKYLKKSKLVICFYPQTAFSESIICGPSILLYDFNKWPLDNKFRKIHEKLIKYNIAFNDPKEAATHVNAIWNKVDVWWNSKDVRDTVNDFIEQTCPTDENSIDRWKKFLNKELEII